MVNQHKVLGATQEGEKLRIPILQADGDKCMNIMPKDIFVYRAAEYGIDPTDIHALLDIILHEKYLNTDPAAPSFVYNTDEETARMHLLSGIAQAKQADSVVDPDGHLAFFHTGFRPDLDLHARHKTAVADLRQQRITNG